jgi:hypothetical protein
MRKETMELTYDSVKEEIEKVMLGDLLEKERLRALHRQTEIYNAHKIIANQDDLLMKDIEFLLRSAMILTDIGNAGDWKIQLDAALGILNNRPATI